MVDLSTIALDPAGIGTLGDQLADILRRKIALGELKPGDRLPGVRQLAKACGTSVRIPLSALAALEREGLIASRPRIGAVVLGRKRKLWRGRVLMLRNCVCPDYTGMVLREEIAVALARSNWRVEFVSVPHTRDKHFPNMSAVERELAGTVDFAVMCFGSPKGIQVLEKKSIRYAVLDGSLPLGDNNAVNVIWTYDKAVAEFAADCALKGMGSVFAVSADVMHHTGMAAALDRVGVALETKVVRPSISQDRLKSFRACGYRAVKERLARNPPPPLVFFADDYLAVGGLWAIAEAGLRVPDDIKVVTVSVRNNVPFFTCSLTRIEWHLDSLAAKVSGAILRFLEKGVSAGNIFASPAYIRGKSF